MTWAAVMMSLIFFNMSLSFASQSYENSCSGIWSIPVVQSPYRTEVLNALSALAELDESEEAVKIRTLQSQLAATQRELKAQGFGISLWCWWSGGKRARSQADIKYQQTLALQQQLEGELNALEASFNPKREQAKQTLEQVLVIEAEYNLLAAQVGSPAWSQNLVTSLLHSETSPGHIHSIYRIHGHGGARVRVNGVKTQVYYDVAIDVSDGEIRAGVLYDPARVAKNPLLYGSFKPGTVIDRHGLEVVEHRSFSSHPALYDKGWDDGHDAGLDQ